MMILYSKYLPHKAVGVGSKNSVTLDESTSITEAIRLMKKQQISSVLIGRDSQHVIGIVAERDILYHLIAESRRPSKITLKEIMSSPLITVDRAMPVKDAIALMLKNAIR